MYEIQENFFNGFESPLNGSSKTPDTSGNSDEEKIDENLIRDFEIP